MDYDVVYKLIKNKGVIMDSLLFFLSFFLFVNKGMSLNNDQIKPAISGIVLMGNTKFNIHTNILPNNIEDYIKVKSIWDGLDGVVINVTWSQLEPEEGQYDFTEIQKSINFIKLHNKSYPNKLWYAKLRVWYGNTAPSWYIDGKNYFLISRVISFKNPYLSNSIELKYWSSDFIQKAALLNNALASAYDNNDIIRDVSMTACSSLTDEPFISPDNISSITSEINEGYTNEQYFSCLYNIALIYSGWHSTVLDYSINSFRYIQPNFSIVKDILSSFSIINHILSLGLPNIRFDNHDLKRPLNSSIIKILKYENQYVPLGGTMQMQGPTFDPSVAIPIALSFGISCVELWDKQIINNSVTQMIDWSNELSKNKV